MFCAPTWPSYHVIENHLCTCCNARLVLDLPLPPGLGLGTGTGIGPMKYDTRTIRCIKEYFFKKMKDALFALKDMAYVRYKVT